MADEAGIRRVDSDTGREMFGRKKGDLAGLIIPNMLPGESHVREYRLRLDNPELEYRIDGSVRERAKYIQPAERRNIFYFPPSMPVELLSDTSKDVMVTEGEFKALALWALANHNSPSPRFLPWSIPGVWCFRGVVGKTTNAAGERVDVKGIVPDVERMALKGRRVIIAFDSDAEINPKVRAARWQLTAALIERGATVGLLTWPIEEGKGIDDRIAKIGPDRVLQDIAAVEFGTWQSRLLKNDKGKLIPCQENMALFLENSQEWAGVIGYNEFTAGYVITGAPPSPITARQGEEIEDHFDTEVTRWFERRGLMVKPASAYAAVSAVARRNTYNPVHDFLDSLPVWDGQQRIATCLIDYCGVESSDAQPNEYAMAVGEKFLISVVARILQPGYDRSFEGMGGWQGEGRRF